LSKALAISFAESLPKYTPLLKFSDSLSMANFSFEYFVGIPGRIQYVF